MWTKMIFNWNVRQNTHSHHFIEHVSSVVFNLKLKISSCSSSSSTTSNIANVIFVFFSRCRMSMSFTLWENMSIRSDIECYKLHEWRDQIQCHLMSLTSFIRLWSVAISYKEKINDTHQTKNETQHRIEHIEEQKKKTTRVELVKLHLKLVSIQCWLVCIQKNEKKAQENIFFDFQTV